MEGLSDLAVLAEEEAILTCTISPGDPRADVRWFHKDKEIHPSKTVIMSYDDSTAKLTVKDAQMKNAGAYRCEAVNKLGRVETQCVLTVNSEYQLICVSKAHCLRCLVIDG